MKNIHKKMNQSFIERERGLNTKHLTVTITKKDGFFEIENNGKIEKINSWSCLDNYLEKLSYNMKLDNIDVVFNNFSAEEVNANIFSLKQKIEEYNRKIQNNESISFEEQNAEIDENNEPVEIIISKKDNHEHISTEVYISEIFNKITKPKDCLLAITIPLTKEDCYNDLKNEKKDFIKHCLNGFMKNKKLSFELFWDFDYNKLVNKIDIMIKKLEKWNVKVIQNFKLDDLSIISKYDVFTIIAHYNKNQVEFFDGLYNNKEVIKRIPKDYCGIMDLSFCNSEYLQNEIKWEMDKVVVKAKKEVTAIEINIILYQYTIEYIKNNDINYLCAFKKISDIIKNNKSKLY